MRSRWIATFKITSFASIYILAISCCLAPQGGAGDAEVWRTPSGVAFQVQLVAKNLEVPWSIAFATDGRLFFTERPGRLRVIEKGKLRTEPVAVISEVAHIGEGGLMGLALDRKSVV